jgi:hypothetical protein
LEEISRLTTDDDEGETGTTKTKVVVVGVV